MKPKIYQKIRVAVALFIGALVSVAVSIDSFLLATIAIIIGIVFLILVRSKTRFIVDEREVTVRQKAAQMSYAIFTPTIGIGAVLMLIPTHSGLSVFSKGEFVYLESLGMVFAYLTLFFIFLYAVSYFYFNRKFGGGNG